jgi:hypothetical protein
MHKPLHRREKTRIRFAIALPKGWVQNATNTKSMSKSLVTISPERIEQTIFLIRGERVMLDRDLATLYGVTTSVLNQAVKRHQNRFPPDFMFQLTTEEAQAHRSRSQIVILKRGRNIKGLINQVQDLVFTVCDTDAAMANGVLSAIIF